MEPPEDSSGHNLILQETLKISLPLEPPETLLVHFRNLPAIQNLKRHLGP